MWADLNCKTAWQLIRGMGCVNESSAHCHVCVVLGLFIQLLCPLSFVDATQWIILGVGFDTFVIIVVLLVSKLI